MWDALGLWRTKFFCSLNLTLFWANLNLVEFCLKSESGFKIISKVQLLQQTFVLKKKYSKYQLWDFWTESSLAQWNPKTQLNSGPHTVCFYTLLPWGLSYRPHSLYPAWGLTWTWIACHLEVLNSGWNILEFLIWSIL